MDFSEREKGPARLLRTIAPFVVASALFFFPSSGNAQELPPSGEPLIRPPEESRTLAEAGIDTESFEVGLFTGVYSMEDFSAAPTVGVRTAYHLTEDIFFEAGFGMTRLDQEDFERLTGLKVVNNRNVYYWNFNSGYNLFPGQIFLSRRRTLNSTIYLSGGIGQTWIDNENHFTLNLGTGYKVFLTDWLDVRIDFRDHVFKTNLTGVNHWTNNLASTLAVAVFF
jgi:outer membrane beta-barrel protein